MSTTRKRLCFVLISTGTKLATNVKFKCHLINLLTNVGVARIKVSSKKKQSAKCFIKDIIEPEALQTSTVGHIQTLAQSACTKHMASVVVVIMSLHPPPNYDAAPLLCNICKILGNTPKTNCFD